MKVQDFCAKLDAALATRQPGPERYDLIAQGLRQAFKLKADEVAILVADPEHEVLRFEWPLKLQKTGTIPASSRDSLAARTWREKKSLVNNRFAATSHAAIFEQVKHDPEATERPLPIQKILSVNLPGASGFNGVLQLSRKGTDANQTGPDFTPNDVAAVEEIVQTLIKYL